MNDSYLVLGFAGVFIVLVAMIAFVALLYRGTIKDEDKDFIPDDIEDTVKEIKTRAENVKKAAKGGRISNPRKKK